MLSADNLERLKAFVDGSSDEEKVWLHGYLTALLDHTQEVPIPPITTSSRRLAITYGTESGNAKKLATEFARSAKQIGWKVQLSSLAQYKTENLVNEQLFFTIVSTQGDGEPPTAARSFYDHLFEMATPLGALKYGVLALGDSSYPLFCKTGEDIDERLATLGAKRMIALQKCDVDYSADAAQWMANLLDLVTRYEFAGPSNGAGHQVLPQRSAAQKKKPAKTMYESRVIKNIVLNDIGSLKETHHIELSVQDCVYKPGDSVGIVPENPSELVSSILGTLKIPEGATARFNEEELSIAALLTNKLNIRYVSERVTKAYGALVHQSPSQKRTGLMQLLDTYPPPTHLGWEAVIDILEPITPRLYSISSSPAYHNGEVHLTVTRDFFYQAEERLTGACSDYLSNIKIDECVDFYVHKNLLFALPERDKDIIMIGPGTGIAPFRAFLAERDATGAQGRNWLFFGEQHFQTDFYFQTEIQAWVGMGLLTRLNTAFSRDQHHKIYVQHKMLIHGEDLCDWIQSGAYVYLCGAKEPMAVDVENALLAIIGHGGIPEPAAYLDEMAAEGRYVKDVY